ncbi:MAG: S26 family signal peptidase [Acidimicrobiia bacterium]|nr:S26 family signal peptidase [Acidimicrobiia bacterium]
MANWKRHLGAAGVVAGAMLLARLTRYEIVEESMQPTLSPGDWVLGVRHPQHLGAGDIVVLDLPGRPGFEIVKRVAAVEGDSLETPDGPRTVGGGEVWVLGDAPAAGSIDSRHFGPVARGSIKAKLIWRYQPLPLTRIGSPVR